MVRYESAILGISLDGLRHYVRVSINTHRATVEGDHLFRAGVFEVEHVINLALEK